MLETIPWGQVGVAGSGWALATYAMYQIITGGLVPRRTHDDLLQDHKEALAANRILTETNSVLVKQNSLSVEVGEMTRATLTAFKELAGRSDPVNEETRQ